MQKYTLRQLEYLIACVDCGSVAAAAERLNVSQPTVSVAIAKLEAQLGVQLLLRHHAQGVTPTTSADNILPSARSLLAQADDLESHAMRVGTGFEGELKLGSLSTLAPVILPGLIRALGTAYPGIRVSIKEGAQEVILDALTEGRLDQILLYDINLPDGLHQLRLARPQPYAALPEGHPLSDQPDVSLQELVTHPLILLDLPPSHDFFLGLFRAQGLEPRVAHSSPSIEMVRGMVGQGLGYSVLVTRPHGDVTYDGRPLVIRPIREVINSPDIVIARLSNLRPTGLMAAFETVATTYFIP